MDTRTSPIRLRITQLREVLAREGVHALLVPSADPHLSEYLPGRWQGREWLSGFTGSMATLVVTADRAALFADSRYWVQAEAELAGTGIELVKIPTGILGRARRLAGAAGAARRGGGGRRPGAGPGRGRRAEDRARRRRRAPAHRRRPARRDLARPPRAAGRAGLRTRAAAGHAAAQRQRWPRCARRWRATAPRTTSCPPSTTWPGSPTCAAATSATTRCSWPTCCWTWPAARCSSAPARWMRRWPRGWPPTA